MDQGGMENFQKQAASKVLSTDGRRKEATDARTFEVVAAFGRDRRRAAAGKVVTTRGSKETQRCPVTFWRRDRRDAELEEEVQSHLGRAARERVERGDMANEAERAARRAFGNVGLGKEVTRDMWGGRGLRGLYETGDQGVRRRG